ncbi:hypothetical protein PCASD_02091 [Puccinia coronata f. sp. avenae]|uniref:Uncharacterized protein n=1 Tax=Puccinia coronata f. sp. avenae TaxID=200324 RepID=A0A2N5VPY2_9BASI|nr:hypothetical protein PCASD_02091 [Puccinia coronata f. sp. avenae]
MAKDQETSSQISLRMAANDESMVQAATDVAREMCNKDGSSDPELLLEQPCSTGGRTDTVRPKREPTGRTDLSDRSRLVLCNRSQELIGQACPTRRQVLRSDSACPTTGRTRLFEHRLNCRVRPVNAGSVADKGKGAQH